MKHYVIYRHPAESHSTVYLVCGENAEAAIRAWLQWDVGVPLHPDLAGDLDELRPRTRYPHVLALLEAVEKTCGEWQIREVREGAFERPCEEIFCGEHPHDVADYVEWARARLRKEVPRVRVRAFVWYLRSGVLVTFYRQPNVFRIEVVRRYLVKGRHEVEPWEGTYADLMDQLLLRWWDRDER